MVSHNVTPEEAEHAGMALKRPQPCVMPAHHNISSRLHSRHITVPAVLGGGTGVLIVGLPEEVLRQEMVEPTEWRSQPFYPRVAPPGLLEGRHLVALNPWQVEGSAIAEVDARPHRGIVT